MDKNITPPFLTVLMAVYNGEKYLCESIDSILNQTFSDFEFIIIDDGSTDNSNKIISSYNDQRIFLHRNETNKGLIFSLNKGIDLAVGKYIARMDADDISLKYRFETQINFLKQNPKIALTGSSAIIINSEGLTIQTVHLQLTHNILFSKLFFENTFFHTSVMGKTEVFRKFKYNENYYLAEDYFLWSQIAENYFVANIDNPLIKYREHNQSISVQKSELQNACVKSIFSYHLAKLGVTNISENDLEFHYNLITNTRSSSLDEDVFKVLKWVRLLIKINKNNNRYNKAYFNKKLKEICSLHFNYNNKSCYKVKSIIYMFSGYNSKYNLKMRLLFFLRCLGLQK